MGIEYKTFSNKRKAIEHADRIGGLVCKGRVGKFPRYFVGVFGEPMMGTIYKSESYRKRNDTNTT